MIIGRFRDLVRVGMELTSEYWCQETLIRFVCFADIN